MSKKLPQGWIRKKIKELPILISDGNYSSKYPKAEELIAEGIPFIRVNNLQNNTIVSNDMKYISKDKHNILLKGHLKENDVLITVRGDLGKVAIVPKEYDDANINAQIALLRITDSSILNSKFLLYSIKNPLVQLEIDNCKTGSALKQLPIAKLKEIYLNIPSLEEQKRIVSILETAEKAIQKREESNQLLDEYLKSVFIDMFGDPVLNSKIWEKLLCKDITLKIGSGATPKGGNSSYKEEGISLIRSMNVHNNKFIDKDLAFIDDEQAEKLKNVTIEENDVLLNITGASVARCCIVPNEYIPARVNQHVAIIRCKNEKILPNFLSYQLTNKSYQRLLWDIATSGGATREAITKQQIEKLELIVPPIELQKEFTSFIHQVDKLKFKMESSLKELENNFNSLMQKAFNGEL